MVFNSFVNLLKVLNAGRNIFRLKFVVKDGERAMSGRITIRIQDDRLKQEKPPLPNGKIYYPDVGIYDYPHEPTNYAQLGNDILSNGLIGSVRGVSHAMPWIGRLAVEHQVHKAIPEALNRLGMDMTWADFRHRTRDTMLKTHWFDESHPEHPYQKTNQIASQHYRAIRFVGRSFQALGAGVMIYNIRNSHDPVTQTGIELGRMGGAYAGAVVGSKVAGTWARAIYTPERGYRLFRFMPPVMRVAGSIAGGVYGAIKLSSFISEVGVSGLPRLACQAVYDAGRNLGDLANHPAAITLPAIPFLTQRALNHARFGQWQTLPHYLPRASFKEPVKPWLQPMSQVRQAASNRDQFKWAIDAKGRFRISPVENQFGQRIHHPDLFGSRPVVAAGEYNRRSKFSNHSGHYQPRKLPLKVRNHCLARALQHPVVRTFTSAMKVGGAVLVFADATRIVGVTSAENPRFSPTAAAMLAAGVYYPPALLVPVGADMLKDVGVFYESAGRSYEQLVAGRDLPVMPFDGITEHERAIATQMLGRGMQKVGQGVIDVIHWIRDKGDRVLAAIAKAHADPGGPMGPNAFFDNHIGMVSPLVSHGPRPPMSMATAGSAAMPVAAGSTSAGMNFSISSGAMATGIARPELGFRNAKLKELIEQVARVRGEYQKATPALREDKARHDKYLGEKVHEHLVEVSKDARLRSYSRELDIRPEDKPEHERRLNELADKIDKKYIKECTEKYQVLLAGYLRFVASEGKRMPIWEKELEKTARDTFINPDKKQKEWRRIEKQLPTMVSSMISLSEAQPNISQLSTGTFDRTRNTLSVNTAGGRSSKKTREVEQANLQTAIKELEKELGYLPRISAISTNPCKLTKSVFDEQQSRERNPGGVGNDGVYTVNNPRGNVAGYGKHFYLGDDFNVFSDAEYRQKLIEFFANNQEEFSKRSIKHIKFVKPKVGVENLKSSANTFSFAMSAMMAMPTKPKPACGGILLQPQRPMGFPGPSVQPIKPQPACEGIPMQSQKPTIHSGPSIQLAKPKPACEGLPIQAVKGATILMRGKDSGVKTGSAPGSRIMVGRGPRARRRGKGATWGDVQSGLPHRAGVTKPEPPKALKNSLLRPPGFKPAGGLILPEPPKDQEKGVIRPPGIIKPENTFELPKSVVEYRPPAAVPNPNIAKIEAFMNSPVGEKAMADYAQKVKEGPTFSDVAMVVGTVALAAVTIEVTGPVMAVTAATGRVAAATAARAALASSRVFLARAGLAAQEAAGAIAKAIGLSGVPALAMAKSLPESASGEFTPEFVSHHTLELHRLMDGGMGIRNAKALLDEELKIKHGKTFNEILTHMETADLRAVDKKAAEIKAQSREAFDAAARLSLSMTKEFSLPVPSSARVIHGVFDAAVAKEQKPVSESVRRLTEQLQNPIFNAWSRQAIAGIVRPAAGPTLSLLSAPSSLSAAVATPLPTSFSHAIDVLAPTSMSFSSDTASSFSSGLSYRASDFSAPPTAWQGALDSMRPDSSITMFADRMLGPSNHGSSSFTMM